MEPRRRRIRATYKQLNLLVKFMSDNPKLARGFNCRTAFGKHYHDAKWTELADLLNAQENGMNKSPREWNRYWKDLKSSIKKKVHSIKKMQGSKTFLSSLEQVIYKDMCNSNIRRINTVKEKEKNRSYLQIPIESDNEQDEYEVEYLEDVSCDEAQMMNITNTKLTEDFDDDPHDNINGVETELVDKHVQTLDRVDQDHILIETIMNEPNSVIEPKIDKVEREIVINNKTNIVKNTNKNLSTNTSTNDDKDTDVLTDIRNHLRELLAVQKDRSRSEQRLASAHERRAILEEKKVRIEERRLKMEETRVALDERKTEALERKSFAQERLASAAERKNEIAELRMSNFKSGTSY